MDRQRVVLFAASLAALLIFLHIAGNECAGQSDSAPSPVQASGKLTLGPIEFIAPQGYWYFPRAYPEGGLTEGQTFVLTFFQKKEDIPVKRDEPQGLPGRPFLNFFLLSSRFTDFQSYYDAVSRARKARGLPEEMISYRELPRSAGRLFDGMTNWNCREETIRQETRPLFGVNCVALGETGVIQMSAHGQDERDVLGTAPLLRDIMRSLTIRKTGKKGD
jgi:hypothetical protein